MMAQNCKSTLTIHKYSFLLFLFIMTFFLLLILQQISLFVTTLCIVIIDYFTSHVFYNCKYNNSPNNIDNAITIKNTQKPVLLIDTTKTINENEKESNIISTSLSQHSIIESPKSSPLFGESIDYIEFSKSIEPIGFNKSIPKRRHYSVSSHSDIDFFNKTPDLSPSASSISSFSSNWTTQGRRPSQVEEMIYLFETGIPHRQPQRRYSVDSHNYKENKKIIRERKFEYKPIVNEWEKRVNSPIQLSPSKSTPVKRKMPPILEKSKSTWA